MANYFPKNPTPFEKNDLGWLREGGILRGSSAALPDHKLG